MKRKGFGGAAVLTLGLALASACGPAAAATADRSVDGQLADGTPAETVLLAAANGVTARVLAYGATLQSYALPDRQGQMADVILGHDHPAQYEARQDFFGATVGRYANRIARGTFTIDGRTYHLPLNNGENSLHGGGQGFDRRTWTIESVVSTPQAAVTLALTSPSGDQGYPGEVKARVTYALDDKGALTITMTASSSAPTIINMTNHALFNLAGQCSAQGATGNRLTIPAGRYTPVNATLIPTGALAAVQGTPFDFRAGKSLADGLRAGTDPQILVGRGFDHNWVLDKGVTAQPELVARAEDPVSGRALEVLSTEPGLQMYTGNFLDGTNAGKGGCLYRMGDGFALEPQRFPDTPNQPAFGSARLDPGQTYRHVMLLRPAVAK
ncbi:galactose mutarotase [Novosphingobium flavum]|uniref:Aldose 1-epimerase n=1 Tax=Novosphingobium aerophilum TaxID=2839843 RepID=A0A7X1F9K4_9SPHN|nr:aldose epimerase family protein [Novosphingobium aerophilum]MBC2652943.1 galactose mutarotase [Novosphingobium aerophilum]MBC2662023.1 galactose mutarotase [Novosphingobium aerophilum]